MPRGSRHGQGSGRRTCGATGAGGRSRHRSLGVHPGRGWWGCPAPPRGDPRAPWISASNSGGTGTSRIFPDLVRRTTREPFWMSLACTRYISFQRSPEAKPKRITNPSGSGRATSRPHSSSVNLSPGHSSIRGMIFRGTGLRSMSPSSSAQRKRHRASARRCVTVCGAAG